MSESQTTDPDKKKPEAASPEVPPTRPQMTEDDEEVIRKRLQELGYIE